MRHSLPKAILVTGGAGYIGSHACKVLASAGYIPVTYDNLSTGHASSVKWGPLEFGDIADRDRLTDVISRHEPCAIMHFAACAYVGESVENPGKYYRNNVAGTLNLLEVSRDCGVRNVVFSSTCATYGVPDQLPISESTIQAPINPYGSSKLMVERILRDFTAAHGLRTIVLRYFNAAGADPDGEIGEHHDPETHLIPLLFDAALGLRPHAAVYGTDYPTADGTCVRDFIHVNDIAEAHVAALKALEAGKSGWDVFNLGNGEGFSVRQVIGTAEETAGVEVPVRFEGRRPGDPAALVSNSAKAREVLNWTPKLHSLPDIIRTAWAWHVRLRGGDSTLLRASSDDGHAVPPR